MVARRRAWRWANRSADGGVAHRLAPEVDQEQERVAFAAERGHEAAGGLQRRGAGRELGLHRLVHRRQAAGRCAPPAG